MAKKREFTPALRFSPLTRFFDLVMGVSGFDKKIGRALLEEAGIESSDHILDFGCGTGTLAIMIAKKIPGATIQGVDIDPEILQLARSKVKTEGYNITFSEYDGILLPYDKDSFDKVLSGLVFHHLNRINKIAALMEIYRVLKAGGRLFILDFGRASNPFMRALFLPIQLFDGVSNTKDNIEGQIPVLMEETGFGEVRESKRMATPVGNISLYRAVKLSPG